MPTWPRNAPDAIQRRVSMIVQKVDGTLAPRDTDFIDLGYVKIKGVTSPHFALAAGSMTNDREPLMLADDVVEAVDTGADTLTLTAHLYETLDGPLVADEPLGTINTGVDFWVRKFDADKITVHASLADAIADTRVALAGTETGATISDIPGDTMRGIDGHFTYEAAQAETDHGAPETIVIVNGTDYERDVGAGAFSHVEMSSNVSSFLDEECEDGVTWGQGLRGVVRQNLATRTKSGTTETTRNLGDTKDSHHGTVTGSGRVATIDDLDP